MKFSEVFLISVQILSIFQTIVGEQKPEIDNALDGSFEQPRIWSSLLEEWTINSPATREGRVMQTAHKYIPTSNLYISKRVGNVAPLGMLKQNVNFNGGFGNGANNGIENGNGFGNTNGFSNQNGYGNSNGNGHYGNRGPQTEVSETDLYLLGAIEKLVYRVDYMEKRLRKTEQIVYYLMSGNNEHKKEIEADNSCPRNFTNVGDACYLFSMEQGVNWKTANNICRSHGAQLAELETLTENNDIIAYLLNHHNLNGYSDFWLGGLNPGLLWIWSSSGRPVNPNVNLTRIQNASTQTASAMKIENKIISTVNPKKNATAATTTTTGTTASATTATTTTTKKPTGDAIDATSDIQGNGRCLGIVYKRDRHIYKFHGVECTNRLSFVCELPRDRIKRELERIAKRIFP